MAFGVSVAILEGVCVIMILLQIHQFLTMEFFLEKSIFVSFLKNLMVLNFAQWIFLTALLTGRSFIVKY
jgi:hypothetical protein